MIILGAALLAVTVGTAHIQDRLTGEHLVTITVAEERPYTLAHTIQIEAETVGTARSRAELDLRVWRASRTSGRGVESATSETCPALGQAVQTFTRLPPLQIAPPPMRVQAAPFAIPPTMKDGYSTRLTFRTLTLDGSEAVVELRRGNAYAEWANETVSSMIGCWGPLRPGQ